MESITLWDTSSTIGPVDQVDLQIWKAVNMLYLN
jgi:hypothetical protein